MFTLELLLGKTFPDNCLSYSLCSLFNGSQESSFLLKDSSQYWSIYGAKNMENCL
ncbi:unnamed protein product [Brugia timori]|uniref:Bm14293 n=2 Tax=Brugia TaxID=6278 RepID=A0A1I9G2J7_BRUMA|nr:Bm14293 [Brugia malayi]VDO13896.1 unnamed protein product [Brugia timori]